MRPPTSTTLLALLALPILALAQAQQSPRPAGPSNAPSQTVITSTILSTVVGIGPNRQLTTAVNTIVMTTTQLLSQPSSNGTTPSGNNTVSAAPTGNATSSGSATQPPANLPTAPTAVAAGGGAAGAPLPGATGGAYGPPDSYIAAASSLQRNSLLVGLGGLVVTAALTVL
ncbi:hypothetical protein FPV67DRAFT_1465761 [Lyophyllum atratum]|nr:hypothetical protein FPV67DRAFT_1465761 [Lyophyllum atratum]